MSAKKLLAIRENLLTLSRMMGKEGASINEVIAAFRANFSKDISEASSQLEDLALTYLLREARSRRPAANDNAQMNLFSSFKAPNQIILKDENGKKLQKNFEECSFEELDQYIDSLPVRQVVSARKSGLIRLKSTISRFRDDKNNNIGKCWQAYLDEQPPT